MKLKLTIIFLITILISCSVVIFNYFLIKAMKDNIIEVKTDNEINKLLTSAKSSYYNGQLEKAIKTYEKILKYRPDQIEAYKNLYFINKEMGNLNKSIKNAEKLLKKYPDNIKWKYKLGIALYQSSKYKQAEEIILSIYNYYKKIIDIEQNNPDRYNILSNKEFSLLCYYLGDISFQLKKQEKAIKFFENGIEASPYQVLNYIELAKLYREKEDFQKSIDYYKGALKKDSSLSFIYPELAELYEKIGKDKEAYYYWHRSFDTNNRNLEAKNRINELEDKHPEFLKKQKEEKKYNRDNIKWIRPKKYTFKSNNLPHVRIGIVEEVNSLSLQASSTFIVYDTKNTKLLECNDNQEYVFKLVNNIYKIFCQDKLIKTLKADNPLILKINDMTHTFLLYDISYGSGYFWAGSEDRQYRGQINLYPLTENNFNVINVLNIEEYLFSVVPSEMPAWWPDEAIKAQTIAARSYTLHNLDKHSKAGYDLCDTVHCAAYNGVKSETDKTNQLIVETTGVVAIYKNSPIAAVFSSNSGGYSEKSNEIWKNTISYLDGANNILSTDLNFPIQPYQLDNWLISEPPSYSNNHIYSGYNNYRWITVLDNKYFLKKYNLEKLIDIIPIGRSTGGTIGTIKIIGKNRIIKIKKDKIRSALGGLKSNRFVLNKIYDKEKYLKKIIVFGSGWGHHVGMDQTGAAGMATQGFKYKDIIKHFYNGVELKKVY